MVHTLETIKSGGGSIKVGTTGTISSLMTRELESIKPAPRTPQTPPVSVACGAKKLQPRKSLDEASTSSSSNNTTRKSHEVVQKTKSYDKSTHRVPMLGSDNKMPDRTANRQKTNKKGPKIVEIVDIRCGQPDRAWANPITNKLKKLGFSKLSESII